MQTIPHVSNKDLPAFRRALLRWHHRHGLAAPWRTSGHPYHVLVAATMAQQTQMSRVLPKFDQFLRAFPTLESLARAAPARVLRVWEGMGYNMRALRLHRAAKRVVREGGFPRTAAELERIDGVGPFTAAIIASFSFGTPVAAVDTNVERVTRRLLGDIDAAFTSRDISTAAGRLLSRRAPGRWNQAMMDLGGTVCTARAPRCDACPIARWCRGRRHIARRPAARTTAARPFLGSTRYYRGRIVQALRLLPRGGSIASSALRRRIDPPPEPSLWRELIDGLLRDGLVRAGRRGRLRLP